MNTPTTSGACTSVLAALAGTLMGQLGRTQGYTAEQILDPDDSSVRHALLLKLSELGIDMGLLTENCLKSLTGLFVEPSNADRIAQDLSGILWTILGDPSSGPPPEIYRKAGILMHITFIGLLSPDIIEPFLESEPRS